MMTGAGAPGEPFDRRRTVLLPRRDRSSGLVRAVRAPGGAQDTSTDVERIVDRPVAHHGGEVTTRHAVDRR